MQKFWHLDDVLIYDHDVAGLSFEDQKAVEMWKQSIKHINGHYEMCIPFKNCHGHVPNSRLMAARLLALLGKKLKKDPSLAQKYVKDMSAMLESGYAEPVDC